MRRDAQISAYGSGFVVESIPDMAEGQICGTTGALLSMAKGPTLEQSKESSCLQSRGGFFFFSSNITLE